MVAKASESKKLEQGAMKKELTEDIMVTPKVTPKVTPVMTPILTPPNPFNFKEEAVVASSSQAPEEVLEPQEVRDERAREARNFFNKKDAEAKDIEKQAKAARAEANEAKKVALLAKDKACQTRFGGKFLCVRGFGSGF